jgi:integrase
LARGSLRLRHRKPCPLVGVAGKNQFDSRKCRCGPRVIGRLNGRDSTLGYLDEGWPKGALDEFEDKLHDLRDPRRRKRAERSPLLREWYAEWIVGMEAAVTMGKIAPRTVDAYKQRWRLHIEKDPIAEMAINAIEVRDLRRFVTRRMAAGISHRYANELLTPISAMLTDAEIDGYIESNPCRAPRRARHGATQRNAVYEQLDRKPPQHLEIEDAKALLFAMTGLHQEMALFVLTTGARRAEMLAARFEDVRWAQDELELHYQLDERRERVSVKAGRKREAVLWSGLRTVLGRRRRQEVSCSPTSTADLSHSAAATRRYRMPTTPSAHASRAGCGMRSDTPMPRTFDPPTFGGKRWST